MKPKLIYALPPLSTLRPVGALARSGSGERRLASCLICVYLLMTTPNRPLFVGTHGRSVYDDVIAMGNGQAYNRKQDSLSPLGIGAEFL